MVIFGDHQLMGIEKESYWSKFFSQLPRYGSWTKDREAAGDVIRAFLVLYIVVVAAR